MNGKILAICDNDKEYLTMLQAYLFKKNPAGFEILVFDSVKAAAETSEREPFEILLVGEGIYDSGVRNVSAQKVLILREDGLSGVTEYNMVPKYQSMEMLMRQVLDAFALDEQCVSAQRGGQTAASLISVYAPDRHKGQSAAAFALAQTLGGMGNRTLYISMQPFSGFEELLGTKYEADLTDFMYFALKHSDKLLYKLEGLKRTVNGVDYLPPALDYSDLLAIGEEEWKRCLDLLLYNSGYTHVVADLTETCQGFYHFLEKSDSVYVLSGEDALSKAMRAQFTELLAKKELGAVSEKLTHFHLTAGWENGAQDFRRLSHSPIGVQMKGMLRQNG